MNRSNKIKVYRNRVSIGLPCGRLAFVSLEDERLARDFFWTFKKVKGGFYVITQGAYKEHGLTTALLSRLIMSAPRGVICDHINGLTLNNMRHNLRLVNPSQSSQNRKSRFNGISFRPNFTPKKPFHVAIRFYGKRKHLGCFATYEEALFVRESAKAEYHGDFARQSPREQRSGKR